MKQIKCCKVCVVAPMCTSGCGDLWNYHQNLKSTRKKRLRINKWLINTMLVLVLCWCTGTLTGFVSLSEGSVFHTIATIELLNITFLYWWYVSAYLTITATSLCFTLLTSLATRRIKVIEDHQRGTYIWRKIMDQGNTQRQTSKSAK